MDQTDTTPATPKCVKAILSSFISPHAQGFDVPIVPSSSKINKCKTLSEKTDAETKTDPGSPEQEAGRQSAEVTEVTPKPITNPRDREAFLNRLSTFRTSTWFAKPVYLSPLRSALLGWENVDVDILKCVTCKETLCLALSFNELDKNTEKWGQCLEEGHSKICPWPHNPSPDSFTSINFDTYNSTLDFFCDGLRKLARNVEAGLEVDERAIKRLRLDSDSIASITAILNDKGVVDWGQSRDGAPAGVTRPRSSEERLRIVTALVLTGWTWSDEISEGLHCSTCRRAIGTWNYRSVGQVPEDRTDPTENDGDPVVEPEAKKFKSSSLPPFDPTTEHYFWCPWVSGDSSCGWMRFVDIINPDRTQGPDDMVGSLTTTPPQEAWKAVRQLLNNWTSPNLKKNTTVPTLQSTV